MNVMIVEDEMHTSELLKSILNEMKDTKVVAQRQTVVGSIEYLKNHQADLHLCFFDIELSDGSSFEIFKHIDVKVPIVFCTAYDEYGIKAIKSNGIDYILKPFKESDVAKAVDKYKELSDTITRQKTAVQLKNESSSYQKIFLTHYGEKSIIVKSENVALFHIKNEIVYLYTKDEKRYRIFKKMEYIESVCDPKQFFRINRQTLVRRSSVASFEPYFNRKLKLNLNVSMDDDLIVSRLKVSHFKKWINAASN